MLWQKGSFLRQIKLRTCSCRFISSSKMVCVPLNYKVDRTHSHKCFVKNVKQDVTNENVNSTLSNCKSDLSAMSIFLWLATRPNYFHDKQAIDHMVPVVSRLTWYYISVNGIVEELRKFGCTIKAQTFLLLIRIYSHGKMYEMVLEAYSAMKRFGFTPNTFASNMIMDIMFKSGCFDEGLSFLKEIKLPNFLSFNIALGKLCNSNNLVNIKCVMMDMLLRGYYPNVNTFETVLNRFCKMGRLFEAQQLLGLMITLGIFISVDAWNMLIHGFCGLHRVKTARALLEKMVNTGCSPNVKTYTILIKGYMESQMVRPVFDILSEMEAKGCAPDLVLYNVLIDFFSRIGRFEEAIKLFLSLSELKLAPDSYTLCALLSVRCLSQRYTFLCKLVAPYHIEHDIMVCNSLLSYYCKAGLPSLAVDLFNDMEKRGPTPDKYSYVGLLNGLCGSKRIDEAVNTYRWIVTRHSDLDAHVHTVIIGALIKAGQYHRAIELFQRVIFENYQTDAVSYMVALRGLVKGQRSEEALSLYNHMKELNMSCNAYIHNAIFSLLCKQRDVQKVEELLKEISQKGIELDRRIMHKVCMFLCKYHPTSSALKQLIRVQNLRLIADQGIDTQSSKQIAPAVVVGANHSTWNGNSEGNLFVDSSDSDDLSVTASSMGR